MQSQTPFPQTGVETNSEQFLTFKIRASVLKFKNVHDRSTIFGRTKRGEDKDNVFSKITQAD
jgi:hypothetical protein